MERSVAEGVTGRASVYTRDAAVRAAFAPKQNCFALLSSVYNFCSTTDHLCLFTLHQIRFCNAPFYDIVQYENCLTLCLVGRGGAFWHPLLFSAAGLLVISRGY